MTNFRRTFRSVLASHNKHFYLLAYSQEMKCICVQSSMLHGPCINYVEVESSSKRQKNKQLCSFHFAILEETMEIGYRLIFQPSFSKNKTRAFLLLAELVKTIEINICIKDLIRGESASLVAKCGSILHLLFLFARTTFRLTTCDGSQALNYFS